MSYCIKVYRVYSTLQAKLIPQLIISLKCQGRKERDWAKNNLAVKRQKDN